jgi:hypothetical protein
MSSSTAYDQAPTADDKVSIVRLMLGGNDGASPLFTNAELEVVLQLQPVPTYAAAALWDMAAAKWASQVDQSIGATSISLSKKAEAARAQADRLRAGGPGYLPGGDGSGTPTAEMLVGGISVDQRIAYAEDTDAIQPSFSVGMDDDPDGDQRSDVNLGRWRY